MNYRPDKKYKISIRVTKSKDIAVNGNEVKSYIKRIKEKYKIKKENEEVVYWVEEM